MFLGDRTSPPNMNDLLFKDGAGVLPASIGSTVGEVSSRQPAFEIKPLVVDRPPLDYFADERIRAALIGVPIYRFFSVTPPADATGRVGARAVRIGGGQGGGGGLEGSLLVFFFFFFFFFFFNVLVLRSAYC